MTRTDNDSWDLASSVGATATLVAAARAAASKQADPLIDDPYAEPLVRAVGVDFFIKMADGAIPAMDDEISTGMSRMTDNMAVRTKFFDEFFLTAAKAGVRQAVILASGLDSRGLPPGVAGGHGRLRDRPARGHRVQVRDARRAGRHPDMRSADRGDRPAQ